MSEVKGQAEVEGKVDDLLERAWSALGGDSEALGDVRFEGITAGLLPSPLPAMAAVAVSTLSATELESAEGRGTPAPVWLDPTHVALAARSEAYARRVGSDPQPAFAPLSRFWRSGDGWIRTHANYPWHRERLLGVLGCGDNPEQVAEAISSWRGEELEDALASKGALGFAVRTRREWLAHRQGVAVASLPLAVLDRRERPAGRSFLGEGRRPRVLDLTRVIAGPVATRTLAAWGAEVLRMDCPSLPELPSQLTDTLPGKRSALVDFSDSARPKHARRCAGCRRCSRSGLPARCAVQVRARPR